MSRYTPVMLWFFNSVSGLPRFIGIHCDRRPDAYQLVVLYPDGSEECERFDDSLALLDAAKPRLGALPHRHHRHTPRELKLKNGQLLGFGLQATGFRRSYDSPPAATSDTQYA